MIAQNPAPLCSRCRRTLSDARSIARGMGPTCARKAAYAAAREEMEAQQADEAKADNIIPFPVPAPAAVAPVYTVPADVTVFAVSETDARRPVIWGRCLKRSKTSRVNHFTDADLVEVNRTGYVFRLRPNRHGLALLMVPAEYVQQAAA